MSGPPWLLGRADAVRLPLADRSVDLVVGSPPYLDARTYGIGAQRNLDEWVAWMLRVTAEALRVSRGLVVWVCAGVTRDRTYQPGPEALLADWVRAGGSAYRPVYWHRYGISGSGGDQWFRADMEYCLAFKRPGKLPWSDNTANGQSPRCRSGGRFSYRDRNGGRVFDSNGYQEPDIANPGCFFSTGAGGGGHQGHPLAHENEAPYPTAVPAWFIASHCPPGGVVLDPFSGSGTTAEAAVKHGRRAIGLDLRQSQCDLAARRLERPHAPVPRAAAADAALPLFDATTTDDPPTPHRGAG